MAGLLDYITQKKDISQQGGRFIYGLRDLNAENHFRIVDITKYSPVKPLVLVLDGDGTTNTRRANGSAKLACEMLGALSSKCDVLAVSYENGLTKDNIDKNVTELVDNIFLPILADHEPEDVPKLMRNITIISHCAGASTVLSRVEKKLATYMRNLQFSEEDMAFALGQVVCISHAAIYPSERELNYFTEFNCVSSDDEVWIEAPGTWMDFVKCLQIDNSIQISKQDKHTLIDLYTNDISHFPDAFLKDKSICYLYKENTHKTCFVSSALTTDETDHSMLSHTNDDNLTPAGHCVLEAYTTIARMSVMNSLSNMRSDTLIPYPTDQAIDNCNHIFTQLQEQIKE
ncbi:MAG: hypothetical protein J6X00_02545 [Clostridia bacterium]|nr:hypothetical protein [Clostridia bacterium]